MSMFLKKLDPRNIDPENNIYLFGPGGGGPGSGAVTYPDYISNAHKNILDFDGTYGPPYSAVQALRTILTQGNPFSLNRTHNPASSISTMGGKFGELQGALNFVYSSSDWDKSVDEVLSRIDDIMPTDTEIDSDVAAFEVLQEAALGRTYNRLAGGMFDINAVVGTAFPSGLAILESQHIASISQYRAARQINYDKERSLVIMQSLAEITKIWSLKSNIKLELERSSRAINLADLAARTDYKKSELAREVDRAYFPLSAMSQYAGMIGAISGTAPTSKGMTQTAATLGGIMTGIGQGISVGTALGSVEAGIVSALVFGVLNVGGAQFG